MAQEQLSVEVIAEYLGREAFPAAIADVEKIQNATKGLTQAQNVNRKAAEDQAKVIRQQRLATAQLGMQFSQISTQMAGGTPIATIFAQQVGDVGYALSNMGGILGATGRFLAGPFGVALGIAGMAFLSLKGKAKEAEEGTFGFAEVAQSTLIEFGNAAETISKKAFAGFGPEIEYVKEKFSELPRFMAKVANIIVQTIAGITVAIVQTIGNLPGIIKGLIYAAVNSVVQTINFFMEVFAGMVNTTYSIVKNLAAKLGVILPEFQVKFKPFSTKESGLAKIFSGIDNAITDAVTTTYIDADRILARAPSLVKPGKDKKGKKDALKDIEDINDIVEKSLERTMNGVDAYTKAYGDTTRDNLKTAADAFAAQRKAEEDVKNYYFQQDVERADKTIQAYENIGNAISDSFKGMITGAQSFGDAFKSIINSVIDELFRMYVVQQIVGMVKNTLGNVFGIPQIAGMKAIGGSVQGSKPYIVGERGPELFVPSRSGSIVPNGGMGGGMVVNVDARGSSDPAAVRQQVEIGIAQAAPYIIAAAQNRTLKTAGRTRLPGTIG